MRALCISKPAWIWFIGRENPTIRVVLEHFPSLKDKVLPQYDADGYKEIRDPSLRKPDPLHTPEQPHVYRTTHPRDPYFDRAGPRRRKTS